MLMPGGGLAKAPAVDNLATAQHLARPSVDKPVYGSLQRMHGMVFFKLRNILHSTAQHIAHLSRYFR